MSVTSADIVIFTATASLYILNSLNILVVDIHYNILLSIFIRPWAQQDQPIDWIEPNSTARLAQEEAKSGVLGPEDVGVNSNPQLPGSFPYATRVSAHGKQVAPFSRLLRHARGAEDKF